MIFKVFSNQNDYMILQLEGRIQEMLGPPGAARVFRALKVHF